MAYPITYGHSKGVLVIFLLMSKGRVDARKKSEVLQGTLDLMILKTLQGMGPLHGFGIARRLEQLSEEVLRLNEGTVYWERISAVIGRVLRLASEKP